MSPQSSGVMPSVPDRSFKANAFGRVTATPGEQFVEPGRAVEVVAVDFVADRIKPGRERSRPRRIRCKTVRPCVVEARSNRRHSASREATTVGASRGTGRTGICSRAISACRRSRSRSLLTNDTASPPCSMAETSRAILRVSPFSSTASPLRESCEISRSESSTTDSMASGVNACSSSPATPLHSCPTRASATRSYRHCWCADDGTRKTSIPLFVIGVFDDEPAATHPARREPGE